MEQPQHNLRAVAATASKSPTRRAAQVGIVILLHLGLVWGLTSGLAQKMFEKLPEPIVVDVTQEKLPDEAPPPPPPETVKPPPPVAPPPDIQISADIAPPSTNTITTTVAKPTAQPNPMEGVTAAVQARKVNCLADFYPALSARMHETGAVTLSLIIGADGVTKNIEVEKSSGKPRLDEASIACVKTWRYKPAMKNGEPIEIPSHPTVNWALQ